jgi:ribosomal protein S18 acetylase RimI-like enzyme
MEIEYRHINKQSFEEVKYFLLTHEYSWRDSDPKNYKPKDEEKRVKSTKKFMEDLEKPGERYGALGAFVGTELVGSHFLDRYNIDGKPACHIHGLWIDSEYRGKGIAHALKELGEKWAKSLGCVFMDSNVRVDNKGMIALNEKMGYTVARYNFRKNL